MADFKVIETQEQLDEILKDRIARAKESGKKEALEQFKDYDEVKATAESLSTQVETLKKELETAKSGDTDKQSTIDELNAKISKYENDSAKTKIAHEMGLTFDSVKFLQGETEEEITESAKALKALVGTQTAPLANNEPPIKEQSAEDLALKQMAKELFNE